MISDMNVQNHLRVLSGAGELQRPGAAPQGLGGVGGIIGQAGAGDSDFGGMLVKEIEKVNAEMVKSDVMVQDLATGQSTDVHGTLIQMKKAEIQFQMLVEVRNKMLKAYEEVMRMQA